MPLAAPFFEQARSEIANSWYYIARIELENVNVARTVSLGSSWFFRTASRVIPNSSLVFARLYDYNKTTLIQLNSWRTDRRPFLGRVVVVVVVGAGRSLAA